MKKLLAMIFALLFGLSTTLVYAANEVNICSGPVGLAYAKVGDNIANNVTLGAGFNLINQHTKGGVENVQSVAKGVCQYGIAPERMVTERGFQKVGVVAKSMTMLVCSSNLVGKDTKTLSAIIDKQAVVAVGVQGSAANWVWEEMVKEKPDLKKLNTVNVAFEEAKDDVVNGMIGCAFTATGLNSDILSSLDNGKGFINIIDFDIFGTFSKPPGFKFATLSSKEYPALLKGWGSSVDVLTFDAVLFTQPSFGVNNPRVHALISTAVQRLYGPKN